MFRHYLIALQFMTIFRFKNDLKETMDDMVASMGYYPLVGFLLGGLLTGLLFLVQPIFSPLVTGIILTLALAFFTQGLHLDGLADMADAMFSHRNRERKLEIMKDSNIGTFGALAMIFILGLKAALMADIAARPVLWPALLLAPVWGRWALMITACLSVYARPSGGLGQEFINRAGRRELLPACAVTVVLSLAFFGREGLLVFGILTLLALGGVTLWRRSLGGVTGDILGAVLEISETLGLLAAAALIRIFACAG